MKSDQSNQTKPSSKDSEIEELREEILNLTGMCGGPYDYAHRCSALHCDHCGICDYSEEILAIVEAHTQSKLKAFAGEFEKAIENNQFDSLHVASEKEKIVYSEKPRKDIDLEKFALALKAIKGKAGIE